MRTRTKIIWIAVCAAVLTVFIILGARYDKDYLIISGVAFFFVGLAILGIIEKVKTVRYMRHELKELAEEDPECPGNLRELAEMSVGLTKDAKEKLKGAPIGDKIKVVAIFASFGLFLLTMAVGVFLANLGTVGDGSVTDIAITGFILMGIGGGGFFLEIILLVVISSIANRK